MSKAEVPVILGILTALAVVLEALVPLGWKIVPLAFISYTSYRLGKAVGVQETKEVWEWTR